MLPQELTREQFLQALQGCESEPFLATTTIGAHGLLLALQAPNLQIVQLSLNTEQHLGLPPEKLLYSPVAELIGEEYAEQLFASLENNNQGVVELNFSIAVAGQDRLFEGLIYRSSGLIILELEPVEAGQDRYLLQLNQQLIQIGNRLQLADGLQQMCNLIVNEVRSLVGYDQVMVYRFDQRGHGTVIAENRAEHMPVYLDQRFPATDVPRQVRRHAIQYPLRMSPDLMSDGIALAPANNPLTGRPLELAPSQLRTSHPWCRDFYRNMGVRAKLVIGIVHDNQLWGYLTCHHAEPKIITRAERSVLQLITQHFAAHITSKSLTEEMRSERRLWSVLEQLQQQVENEIDWSAALQRQPQLLLDLIDATGAAIMVENRCYRLGTSPSERQVIELVGWLAQRRQSLFVTEKLAELTPLAQGLEDCAAGLLAITVSERYDDWVLWFRPEVVETVRWAGKPSYGLRTQGERVALSSRHSFQQWAEQVRGQSAEFRRTELEMASRLRNALYRNLLRIASDRRRQVEAELNAQQAWLDDLLNSLLDVVWSYSLVEERMPYISAPIATITGHTPQEFTDDPTLWFAIVHPDDRERVQRAHRGGLYQSTFDLEYRISHADGSLRWLRSRGHVRYDDAGNALQLDGLTVDISDRKRAEEGLRISEERFRQLVDSSIQGILVLDMDGEVLFANPASARLLGYDHAWELLGLEVFVHLLPLIERDRLRGISSTTEAMDEPEHYECEILCRDGSYKIVETLAQLVNWQGQQAIQATIIDITARHAAERELRQSEAWYRGILSANPDVIIVLDQQGIILDVFTAQPQLLIRSVADIRRHHIADHLPATFAPKVRRMLQQVLVADDPLQFDYTVELAAEVRTFQASLVCLESHEGGRILWVARDITQLKDTEIALRHARDVALEASHAKSAFLANVSHELRTPLNSIIGFSGILMDGLAGPVNDEQSRQLSMVHASAKHLLALINDILDLSKVEMGNIEVYSQSFAVEGLLDELYQLLRPQAESKGLQLLLEITANLPAFHSDPNKLRQILLNLLGNAIKFTEKGTVSLVVNQDDAGLAIQVIDTGIGIDTEHQDSVFHAFYQVDSSDSRRFQGTGLGLAICRRLVELLGGEVLITSVPQQGTTFEVRLPWLALDEPVPRPTT